VTRVSGQTGQNSIPKISKHLLSLFAIYSRLHVHRHFHSVRILQDGLPPADVPAPLLIYLNHASWWDPLICLLLARIFFPERNSYAPIDAGMLNRYGFFKHLGFYGINVNSKVRAKEFVSISSALLASTLNAIWLTPQGRFADVRKRPLEFQPGIGVLAATLPGVCFLPLAIEYTFWTEPRPEALLCFGEPITSGSLTDREPAAWTNYFGQQLEIAQQKLADRAMDRESGDWMVLEQGVDGITPIYDASRWLQSRVMRRPFVRGHSGTA
jgi:1-acyl-sn-glycerol-3-phosphate acyltransferase